MGALPFQRFLHFTLVMPAPGDGKKKGAWANLPLLRGKKGGGCYVILEESVPIASSREVSLREIENKISPGNAFYAQRENLSREQLVYCTY